MKYIPENPLVLMAAEIQPKIQLSVAVVIILNSSEKLHAQH